MGIYAITGGTTGIGAAITSQLEAKGDKVINIDIKEGDIIADLSKKEGRQNAIKGIHDLAPDGLDGFIPCAGLGPQIDNWPLIVSVNYFAARILTEGIKDLVAKKNGSIVVIVSNSAALPGIDETLTTSLLEENDEAKAHDIISKLDGTNAYAGSKQALTKWMRRTATQWANEGIRMNAVAPGATMTPLLQAGLDDPRYGQAIREFPVPQADFGTPEQIANVVVFLLSDAASFCCGSVFFVDGGTDALLRPDSF